MHMSRKLRLAVLLPRGEAIRNVLYTGMLDHLRAECDLYIASVKPCQSIWNLMESKACSLIEIRPNRGSYGERLTTELIHIAHGRHVWSVAARDRWARRSAEAQSLSGKIKLAGKRALAAAFGGENRIRLLEDVESRLVRLNDDYAYWKSVINDWRPDLLFNASHVHGVSSRALLAVARDVGIPLAAFIFSWDNLTSQGRILPSYDYYFVWSEWIAEQLFSLYPRIRRDQVVVSGTPQFDVHFLPELRWSRYEFCKKLGLDPGRPIVLYTTGMPNHMPFEEEIVEGIADKLAQLPAQTAPQLLVRVYAKDRTGRFDRLFSYRPDIARVPTVWEQKYLTPLPEDNAWYVNALAHCDVGINVASTVSVELMIHGKPVINIGYDPSGRRIDPISYARYYSYDHYEPLVKIGAVEVVWKPEDLLSTLVNTLQRPLERSDQRRIALERLFWPSAKGGVAPRMAKSIVECARRFSRDDYSGCLGGPASKRW